MFNLSRQAWIGITAIFVVVLSIWAFLSFDFGGNKEKEKEKNQKSNQTVSKYDGRLEDEIVPVLTKENRGDMYKGFRLESLGYLVSSRSSTVTYNDTYPADLLSWVVKDGETWKVTPIGTSHVHSLYTENNSPFFYINGKTLLFFGEKTDGSKHGQSLKGFVYEIDKKGNIKLSYETQGIFDSIGRNKENELVLYEKEFTDYVGMYPISEKPYTIYQIKYEDGKWKRLTVKKVQPTK